MERAWERKVALARERDDLADVRLWCKQGLQVRVYQESNKSVDSADIGAYNIWCIAGLSKYLLKKDCDNIELSALALYPFEVESFQYYLKFLWHICDLMSTFGKHTKNKNL